MATRNLGKPMEFRAISAISLFGCAFVFLVMNHDLAKADSIRELPGWQDDDQAKALPAILRGCEWAERQPGHTFLGDSKLAGRITDWLKVCGEARRLPAGNDEAVRRFLETRFQTVSVGTGLGRLSAYHVAALHGSWKRTSRFDTPIYRKPADGGPMPTREKIAGGALAGRGLELLWVDDPVAAYFMEIEGSAHVKMTDGSMVDLDFDGQNGHRYRDLGREIVRLGLRSQKDADGGLEGWLRADRHRARQVMNLNPSQVFFKIHKGSVKGATGMDLTPGRSVAVDPRHIPLGVPIWLDAKANAVPMPGGGDRRLVVAADTGGDIKGKNRVDLFVGQGHAAEHASDRLDVSARLTLLVPRVVPEEVAEFRARE